MHQKILLIIVTLFSVAFGSYPAAADTKTSEGDWFVEIMNRRFEGDLDQLLKAGFIRIASVRNPLFFNINSVEQSGLLPDATREFKKFLKKKYGKKAKNLTVVIIPVSRDRLLPALQEGAADIAVANITITPERKKQVNFSKPTYPNVKELLVTKKGVGPFKSLGDLGDTPVHIRQSSSYYEHLTGLNKRRKKDGLAAIKIEKTHENLEDYDTLEMMNAGVIPAAIVDSHKAELWAKVFPNISVHNDIFVSEGNTIAWAVRKTAPNLLKAVNAFVPKIRKGSLLGNILLKRYMAKTDWIDDIREKGAAERYNSVVDHIRKYSLEHDFDWLMIAAQGYQESKLDQTKKSHVGAIGIMQVMPATASDKNVNITDIHIAEKNVHAGVKYLRFLRDRYYTNEDIAPEDQVFFSFAAYNAGPGNVIKARKLARKMNFNPNKWFGNVEVAMAKAVSQEPVIYVRNILKYYISYRLLEQLSEDSGDKS